MQRHKESQKNNFDQYVKLGEENAEFLRQMSYWCKHVEINRVSGGLYAEITGLPIASHGIGCPYVEGVSQSLNLRWIFSDFLVQHCSCCLHHIPNGNTSWGQKIIDDYRENIHKREQVAKENADRISQLRSDLRLKTKKISIEAEPESHRILEFLDAVFSEDESRCHEAITRLKQSVQLAPELFPDAAINLILGLASYDEYSSLILPLCAELAARRSDLTPRLSSIALSNIEKGLQPELSAWVLDQLGNSIAYPLSKIHIERLLLSQDHCRPIGGWENGEPDYLHSTAVIIRCFDIKPESVLSIIRRELQNKNDYKRVQLCGAIELIQHQRPEIALNLMDDLIRSLELYEDHNLSTESPSRQIISILQSAFRYSSDTVDKRLARSMDLARPAVQEDIIRIYHDQFFDHNSPCLEERLERKNRVKVSEPEETAIKRLLAWIKDDNLDIDIRAEATDALECACHYATAGIASNFDSMLGYFAIVSGEEQPPAPPHKILLPNQQQEPQSAQLNEFDLKQQWGIFKQRFQECLKSICKTRPSEVFASVCGCLDQPSANIENGFKACCVSLLSEIGKDYMFRPRVLPLIWRALMDYDSALVRAKALLAVTDMFSYSNASPPSNLVDTIIVHLQDQKCIVHKAALRAVSRHPGWFDEKQAIEVLSCLTSHLRAYRNDIYQLDKICDGILAIGRNNSPLELTSIRLVETIFITGEEPVDSNIAEDLMRFCKPTERIAGIVAKNIAMYLGHYERDHYNYYGHSSRGSMFEWLHKLSTVEYQNVAKDLLVHAEELAQRDAWESCLFASLFANYRDFKYEQVVLETAANALPKEQRYEALRGSLMQLSIVAADNASLLIGNTKVHGISCVQRQGKT